MQERGGRKLCVDCEVRNEGKTVEVKEPEKKIMKTEEKPPKKVVSFQEQNTPLRKVSIDDWLSIYSILIQALPPSEWKTVVQMTVESKLIWLSNRLSKTEDYDEMDKILDLIDKATNVAKNLWIKTTRFDVMLSFCYVVSLSFLMINWFGFCSISDYFLYPRRNT